MNIEARYYRKDQYPNVTQAERHGGLFYWNATSDYDTTFNILYNTSKLLNVLDLNEDKKHLRFVWRINGFDQVECSFLESLMIFNNK